MENINFYVPFHIQVLLTHSHTLLGKETSHLPKTKKISANTLFRNDKSIQPLKINFTSITTMWMPRDRNQGCGCETYLILLLFPTLCFGYARSTGSAYDDTLPKELPSIPFQKVPLPPSTSSVKCKCETVGSSDPPQTQIQSRSDDNMDPQSSSSPAHKEIEIQIFKTAQDLQDSEQEQEQRGSPHSAPRSFQFFRTSELLPDNESEETSEESSEKILQLGVTYGPFMGPRRRKRTVDNNAPTSNKNPNVFYVYPVNFYETQETQEKPKEPEVEIPKTSSTTGTKETIPVAYPRVNGELSETHGRSDNVAQDSSNWFSERNIEIPEHPPKSLTLEEAMSYAWEDYGPPSPPKRWPPEPSPLPSPQPIPYRYQVPSYQFQRKESPWDNRITANPTSALERDATEPGFFSPILSNYIDFEVNNHEQADFMRKALFAFGIGILIAGWITLGVIFGLFPVNFVTKHEDGGGSSNWDSKKRSNAESTSVDINGLTDVVYLALDSEWLKKLEERVRKDGDGNFVKTVAKCCIILDKNEAECRLVRKDGKGGSGEGVLKESIKCLSDLIYNFQFGGNEDENDY